MEAKEGPLSCLQRAAAPVTAKTLRPRSASQILTAKKRIRAADSNENVAESAKLARTAAASVENVDAAAKSNEPVQPANETASIVDVNAVTVTAGAPESQLQDDPMTDVEPSSDSDGETGSAPLVIDETVAPTPEAVVDAAPESWKTVESKKTKKSTTGKAAVVAAAAAKKAPSHVVYVKGKQGPNFVREAAFQKAQAFKDAINAEIGSVETIQIVNGSIRITCQTDQQVQKLLKVTQLLDKPVAVTLPRRLQPAGADNSADVKEKWTKGVIKRVPPHVTDEHIALDTGAVWVHRIIKGNRAGRRPTRTVIVAFTSALPTSVTVGLVSFKVHAYVPLPRRCTNCQRFGHKTGHCSACDPTCAKCGESHATPACTRTDSETFKCPNCGLKHSAAYRGCAKFKRVEKTLKVAAQSHLTYAQAAKKVAVIERAARKTDQKSAEVELTAASAAVTGPKPTKVGAANSSYARAVKAAGPQGETVTVSAAADSPPPRLRHPSVRRSERASELLRRRRPRLRQLLCLQRLKLPLPTSMEVSDSQHVDIVSSEAVDAAALLKMTNMQAMLDQLIVLTGWLIRVVDASRCGLRAVG
jgi:hypothetical protein